MVHRTHLRLTAVTALAVLAVACSRGSSVSNAAPRITSVPMQSTTGGTNFQLDLGDFVTDREGVTMTYTVTSGGGSFTGSLYSNTFDAMGEYPVTFDVSDGDKLAAGDFSVQVTSSNFAVVKEDDSGLFLLDTSTEGRITVASSTAAPVLGTGLSDGRLVYQLGSPFQLWVFDAMSRVNTQVGGDVTGAVTYMVKTSTDKFVYTTGDANDQTIYFYNPISEYSREIDDGGLSTLTVLVNASDLVFYEAGVNGQADVFYYDPVDDEVVTVGDSATDEQILAVLPNGACVFSRVGGGGETDLFYYRVGTGLVEIGSDISDLATRNKAYNGHGSANQVVFTATNAGDREIFSWDPATGQTMTVIAGTDNVYDGIGDGNEVVYHTVVSATEHDVSFFDLDTELTAVVLNSVGIAEVLAVTGDAPAYAIVLDNDADTSLHAVSLVGAPATVSWAAGGLVADSVGQLANGDVVGQRDDNTAINSFDVSAGTWAAGIAGVGLAFEGDGLEDGDFVYTVTVSAQVDLSMWDASGANSVVVSDTAGTDDYQALTSDSTILFTRIVGTNTNTDLFVWDGTTETRLTQADSVGLLYDHSVLGTFDASR